MSITVKTRKILWSKSGNRCAICKHELVKNLENENSNFILGEECHIISSKTNGPRGKINQLNNYDTYENLILLCANDHKLIDEYPETFTVDILNSLKINHENWIRNAIQKNIEELNSKLNNIEQLDKINSRLQIENIIINAHAFSFDFSSITNKDQAIELSEFFENLRDFSDIYSDLEISNKTRELINYEEKIQELEKKDILIFGKLIVREYKLVNIPKSEYLIGIFTGVNKDCKFIMDNKMIIKLPDNFTPIF